MAFRSGFNDILPVESLDLVAPGELKEMICGEDTIEWEKDQLKEHLHAKAPMTADHPVYNYLIDILLEFTHKDRQRFLDFVTSCPRLPPGGISKMHIEICGINPKETHKNKSKLPYSRACNSQLFLPLTFASKQDLHNNLYEAMYSSVGNHERT